MKKMISTLLVAVCLTTAASAQSLDLRLELQTDKTDFVLGEPVVVYLALHNINLPDTHLPTRLEPEFGAVTFDITRPDGTTVGYNGWNRTCTNDSETLRDPGDSVYGVSRLFFNGDAWLFDAPGTYVIKATTLRDLCSEEITINVRVSSNPQSGAQLMNDKQAAKYLLFNGGDHLSKGIQTLNQVEKRTDEALRAHINLAFGQAYLEDFANFVEGRVRRADLPRAISYLEKARDASTSLYTRVQAQIMLAEAHETLGNREQAAAARSAIYGDGATLKIFRPWVDYLVAERSARAAAKMKR